MEQGPHSKLGWTWVFVKGAVITSKWLRNYHCTCNSEIGTCITNDTGRQAAHKNNENTRFWSNLAKRRFILMFWRYILTFNAKKLLNKIPNLQVLSLKTFFSFIKGGRLYLLLVLEMDSQCWGRTRKLIINLK
jgi:hypothetical protein